MLSREKEPNSQVKTKRNDPVAMTYDIKNTSTKLVMLNLSNKNENRIREHSHHNEYSTKEFRCCYCLSNTAPACACHHRDKDLSKYPRRHESCSNNNSKKQKSVKTSSYKKSEEGEKEPKWPSLTKDELIALDKKNRRYQMKCVTGNVYDQDLWLLSSIPSLSHPDFTVGQKQCLLSLAKIYTNVSPGPRYSTQKARQNQSKLAPLSHRSSERKSRSKTGKNVKNNKRSDSKKRKESLLTAVNLFQNDANDTQSEMEPNNSLLPLQKLNSETNNNSLTNTPEENFRKVTGALETIDQSSRHSKNSNSTQIVENKTNISDDDNDDTNEIYELELSNKDLDFILTSYVMNIIQQQANLIRQENNSILISKISLTNRILEYEELQNNIEILDDQNIPDDIFEESKKNQELKTKLKQENNDQPKEDEIIETINNEQEFTYDKTSVTNIQETVKKDENATRNEDIDLSIKHNQNINNANPETFSKTGSVYSAESNNLDKINPEIDILTENPLRMLSKHLRQSISS